MDDINDGEPGVQAEVVVGSMGLRGESVDVFRASTVDEAMEADPIGTGTIGDDTRANIEVTLEMGSQDFIACTTGCEDASDPVTVTLTDACASITFVNPTPPAGGGDLTLGPMSDTDGEACGESFGTNILVSTDAGTGQQARLFVNGDPAGSTTIDGMLARFDNVTLGNRGDTPNSLEIEVDTESGLTCRESFPGQVLVDCEGASCDLTAPDPGRSFLNQDDDASTDPGFQGNFEASTDASGADHPIRLEVDGMEVGSEDPVAMGDGGTASFTGVDLEEGSHVVQAVCRDAAGNETRSSIGEWAVDITPCDISISTPDDGALFTDMDDVDSGTDGIQIDSNGTVGGADCSAVRVGVCDGSLADAALDMGDWMGVPTLPTSTGTHTLCAEVEDEAGNIGEAMVDVDVRTEAPELEIVTPSSGDGFNLDGSMGRTPDLDDTTNTCEASFTVNCTEVGADVEIIREGTDTPLMGGTDACEAMPGLDAPFEGQASFSMVSIPTRNGGESLSLVARQSVESLTGVSPSIDVTSDCAPPSLSVQAPMCGSVLRPSMDDSDPGTSGFQQDVSIFNNNTPKPAVDLEIRESATGTLVSSATSSTPSGGVTTEFPDADFSMGGDLDLIACSTDNAGNTGCAPACMVTVADLPVVTVTTPSDGAVLTETGLDGCAAGEIRVQATTDAADGSVATAQVGSGATASTTASGGTVDACVEAADGRDLDVVVTVDDSDKGTASSTVTIDIDTAAPPTAIDDLSATVIDRRGGEIEFAWTAVDDADGFVLDSYELRCFEAPITGEGQWDTARVVTVMTAPASGGTSHMEVVGSFRAGVTESCTLRGVDAAGDLTPLGNSAEVTIDFLTEEVTDPGSAQLGYSSAAVGDVNGDTVDDVVIGAPTIGGVSGEPQVYVYFGSSAGLSTSPDVTITGTHFTFGLVTRGIGDFNGDGLSDFAVPARGEGGAAGTVYVFFGRDSTTPWPSDIDLTAGCTADICFEAADASGVATFGWDVDAADFNADGLSDLVIGSRLERAYVILGSGAFAPNAQVGVSVNSDPSMVAGSGPDGFFIEAPSSTVLFGLAAGSPGSFRGTAHHDLAVGAPGSSGAGVAGKVFSVAGRDYPTGASGLQMIPASGSRLEASGPAGSFGAQLSFGEFDANGDPDLIVYGPIGGSPGRVFLHRGIADGFDSTATVWTNDVSSAGGDLFGIDRGRGLQSGLGLIGDLDGDGHGDILTGSAERGSGPGTVELFFGQSSWVDKGRTEADASFTPTPAGAAARRSVAFVGDVNDDGMPDFALGDPAADGDAGRLLIHY